MSHPPHLSVSVPKERHKCDESVAWSVEIDAHLAVSD